MSTYPVSYPLGLLDARVAGAHTRRESNHLVSPRDSCPSLSADLPLEIDLYRRPMLQAACSHHIPGQGCAAYSDSLLPLSSHSYCIPVVPVQAVYYCEDSFQASPMM